MANSDSEKEKEEDEESVGGVPKIKDMGACRRNLLNHLKENKDVKLIKRISAERSSAVRWCKARDCK